MRLRVKVCGITRLEDAMMACEMGVDALGFNFVPSSPRRIEPARAGEIVKALPPFVTPVAVVVNPPESDLASWLRESGTRVVQFHGEETPEQCAAAGAGWYKAFRVGPGFRSRDVEAYGAPWCLLDAFVDGVRGGTGRSFDYSVAEAVGRTRRVILAGGLTPENLLDAVRKARPHAIDLNSGVERAPGVKDSDRLRAVFDVLARVDVP